VFLENIIVQKILISNFNQVANIYIIVGVLN